MKSDVAWWHFWNPRSGAVGGLIVGVLLGPLVFTLGNSAVISAYIIASVAVSAIVGLFLLGYAWGRKKGFTEGFRIGGKEALVQSLHPEFGSEWDEPDGIIHKAIVQSRMDTLDEVESMMKQFVVKTDAFQGTGISKAWARAVESLIPTVISMKTFPFVPEKERIVEHEDGVICAVCDGGPGNDGPCLCGMKAWEKA